MHELSLKDVENKQVCGEDRTGLELDLADGGASEDNIQTSLNTIENQEEDSFGHGQSDMSNNSLNQAIFCLI